MNTFKDDIREERPIRLLLVAAFGLVAAVLIASALQEISAAGPKKLLYLLAFGVAVGFTTARHPIQFPGSRTSVSLSESLTYLAILTTSPYHSALLAAFDGLVTCRRLKLKPIMYVFNVSSFTISIFLAAKVYYATDQWVKSTQLVEDALGQGILAFALPLAGMACTHYALNIGFVTIMSSLKRSSGAGDPMRDTFTLESATFIASAALAGLVHSVQNQFGLLSAAAVTLFVIPLPIIVHYTFKNYRERVREQQRHYQELNEINDSILQMLAMAIDAKDQTTHEHIQRVRLFASRMGGLIGLSEPEIEALKAGALLHDIGKIGVPAYILNKPGKLTEHEFEQMKLHTTIGADMLSNIAFRYPVVPIVRHHHERWDGKGYPDGLKGESIPVTARILTLVDNYDALRSDRPYHRAMTRQEALDYIGSNAGTFFDPHLVSTFLSVIDQLECEAEHVAGTSHSEASPKKSESGPLMQSQKSAGPAAGFASPPPVNRATAALNSIAETNQRVAALYEMSRTLASSLSVEDTVAILANRLSKMVPFTTCAISLFDPSKSEFEFVHIIGRDVEKFLRRRLPVSAGITGWVIQHQRPMYNTNPVLDLGFLGHEVAAEYRTAMVFPLVKNREPLGAIGLYSTELENYSSEYVLIMEAIAQPASDSVHNALAFERAQRAVRTDPATGLMNIRALGFEFEVERITPLSLLLIRVREESLTMPKPGTSVDRLIDTMADVIRSHIRESDLIARYSDDGLICLLKGSGSEEAIETASRIRDAILRTPNGAGVSIGIGVSTRSEHGETFDDLLRIASVTCNSSYERVSRVTVPALKDTFLH